MMTNLTRFAITLLCAAAVGLPATAAPAKPRDPAAVRQTYEDISSRLDQGGDLFIVANVEGILEEWVALMIDLVKLAPPQPGVPNNEALQNIQKISGFLKKNGFYAVNGFGMSAVPRADQRNDLKAFINRDADAALLPLWRGMVGVSPCAMACLNYLPKDTVIARSGTADFQHLWKMIKDGITEIGGAEAATGFNASMTAATAQLGVSIDQIIGSLAAEAVISFQLSTTAKSPVPMGPAMIEIPQPTMLLVAAVNDNTIIDTIKRIFATQLKMPLPEVKVEDATVHTLPLPIPSPIPVQITLATHGKYLIIGSTTEAVTTAIKTSKTGNGLRTLPEFVQMVPEANRDNNGIVFVSARLGKTIGEVQAQVMSKIPNGPPQNKDQMDFMQKIMSEQFSSASGGVIMNYRSGIKFSGTSTASGRQVIAGMVAAPVGMLAAIAIPSFVKARSTAQHNSCINNLRQLDASKEQWAMANNKRDGAIPDEAGCLEYIKGGKMPVCPQGGVYKLNPIGQDPTCSHPGHGLGN